MTIVKRLRIAALMPAIAGLILAGVLFESHRSLGVLEEKERTVHRIGVAFNELNILARVYMAHHAERPRQQFLLAHDEITRVLASLAADSPEYGAPLKDLAATSDVMKRLFLKLVATYERHEMVGNEALLKEAEERLGGRLVIQTREAVNVASLLVDRVSHDIIASQRRIYVLTAAFLAAAVIALGLVLHGLTRRFAGSLERVQTGIRMIGGGNLDHRIRLSSSDELGELANAFDRMSETLQATTVSRDALAVEAAERKQAEERVTHLASFPLSNPNPVIEVDSSGTVVFANPAAQELLASLELDRPDISAYLPLDLGAILGDWDGTSESVHYREVAVKDRVIAETLHLVPRFHVARIYANDITARKMAEEELRAAKEGLEVRVAERTADLSALAERMQEELFRRRRTEHALEKQAEELRLINVALEKSEERFRTLVQDLPVGVFIVRDGRIVFQNPEQRRLFGPVPDGMELASFRDVHPEDADKFAQLCEAVGDDGGRILEMDLRFFPHGTSSEGADMRWAHVRSAPIVHLGRKAVLVSMADITRKKELEHIVRIREKMASLGHVSAGIAHEIRNPLSGINIYVSAMENLSTRSENLDPEEREKVGAIVEQLKAASNKIATVIKRVMEFSRPDPPQLTQVDLNVAIEAAVQLFSVSLRKKEIALSKALSPNLPRCRADLRLIEQVLLNLINNAAQAMDGLEGPKRIEIGSSADGEHRQVLIRVSDSGPGVPVPIRDRIFDPFFTTRRDGYGIGLSFSHRVVADHGGALTVGSSRWGGAEFRIVLPVPQAALAGRGATAQ